MRAPPLLREFLALVQQMTGAKSVAALLVMEPPERESLLLANSGTADVVPELASETDAWDLIQGSEVSWVSHSPAVQVAHSKAENGTLIRIVLNEILLRSKADRRAVNERRKQPRIRTAPETDGAIWFGLSGAETMSNFMAQLQGFNTPAAPDDDPLRSLTALCTRLAWSVYHLTGSLQDPVSQLPGRMEFQVFAKRAVVAARNEGQSVSLMLVNPDDFVMINHRYGREQGDLTVREIADQILACSAIRR